jgi:hypothetical protein
VLDALPSLGRVLEGLSARIAEHQTSATWQERAGPSAGIRAWPRCRLDDSRRKDHRRTRGNYRGGHSSTPDEFEVSPSIDTDKQAGTVFKATEPAPYVNRLTKTDATAQLTAVFAAYLLTNPEIKISLEGHALDPADIWLHSDEYVLTPEGFSPTNDPLILQVIEWKDEVVRTISLCNEQGVELAQISPNIRVPGHHFTAYVRWSGFIEYHETLVLADFEDEPIKVIVESARDALKEHFQNRDFMRRRQQIAEWKEQGLYPYGEPASPTETIERGLFDEIATTVARQLPGSKEAYSRVTPEVERDNG